jgi:hypothetical protein
LLGVLKVEGGEVGFGKWAWIGSIAVFSAPLQRWMMMNRCLFAA